MHRGSELCPLKSLQLKKILSTMPLTSILQRQYKARNALLSFRATKRQRGAGGTGVPVAGGPVAIPCHGPKASHPPLPF